METSFVDKGGENRLSHFSIKKSSNGTKHTYINGHNSPSVRITT